jgi:hypothetical protein
MAKGSVSWKKSSSTSCGAEVISPAMVIGVGRESPSRPITLQVDVEVRLPDGVGRVVVALANLVVAITEVVVGRKIVDVTVPVAI